ncbi:N-carbamoyl-L-amino acid hydrolase [Tetrabaena socialis]|uniref:N-carbamoyl-L-amino acid hydrolase n=1 Tax=Tetrabaena socialis TaxID=47790 RepID=A0A2J8AA87_9CHLO|nr:N-carbamoyl-L-amino acid hydrolase [Tetrabaena socialis]|eukprot:PNH09430.1 N-carbamoyl-L-amino acid hydrolase [Tetrabaena socialis]
MGNIFGRLEGSEPSAGVVLTGSHCDAIPLAGMYDGTLGVIGAIEALAALQQAGFKPVRPIEVMMFTSEEPTRFALSCSGSRAMAGALTPAELEAKTDAGGLHFLQASGAGYAGAPPASVANQVGYGAASTGEMLEAVRVAPEAVAYFVELHIEQGPFLEREGTDIGVVTAIAAPAALEVHFTGDGGHAGGQLMPIRNDAGLAGAELALAVERHVLGTGSGDTVGTTGTFEVSPGAINSVPREARLAIDIRDTDGPRRDSVVEGVLASAADIAHRRKVRVASRIINQDPPATCHASIVEAVAASAKQLGLSTKHMVSRAYHDSLFMARVAPTGMIFIPCRNGWSHRPDEFSSPEDIANGVNVLALTLAHLSGGSWPKVEL